MIPNNVYPILTIVFVLLSNKAIINIQNTNTMAIGKIWFKDKSKPEWAKKVEPYKKVPASNPMYLYGLAPSFSANW